MPSLGAFSLKVNNFKSFGSDYQGFETIKPVNVIVGRNNTGKSSLLDLVEFVSPKGSYSDETAHKGIRAEVSLGFAINNEGLAWAFSPNEMLGAEQSAEQFKFTNKKLIFYYNLDNRRFLYSELASEIKKQHQHHWANQLIAKFEGSINNPFLKYKHRRLVADRDIRPEKDDFLPSTLGEESLSRSGEGATTIIQRILIEGYVLGIRLPAHFIRETLLDDLNAIYGPDAEFTDIYAKRLRQQNERYEIFLEEKEKGLVSLTHSGSGLKTVILVLLNVLIYPKVLLKEPLDKFIFAFEELENNLHPAVQRRLFTYLRDKAEKEKCYFFLTTHSNVVIDLFGRDPIAQILHVTHDRSSAKVQTISTYLHQRSVLQDLDVRASDLLQSNAIVWVEGPSDRIYFNKWVELWDGFLKEGVHYQCLYSGGGLIEGYTFDTIGDQEVEPEAEGEPEPDPEEKIQEFIEALKINRHSVVMMDRDRPEGKPLKKWVTRIVDELTKMGGEPWVTAGREVENYIPSETVTKLVEAHGYKKIKEFGKHESFYKCYTGPQGGILKGSKTKIARWVATNLKIEDIEKTHDLRGRLESVCDLIRAWNGLEKCPRRAKDDSANNT